MLIALMLLELAAIPSARPALAPPAPAPECADTLESTHARLLGLLRVSQSVDVPALRRIRAVDPAHLRVLTEDSDASLCREIRAKVLPQLGEDRVTGKPWRMAVYEADGFYFALASRDRRDEVAGPGGSRRVIIGEHGPPTLYVFDHDLQPVLATRG